MPQAMTRDESSSPVPSPYLRGASPHTANHDASASHTVPSSHGSRSVRGGPWAFGGAMGVISCAATHFNSHCAAHSLSISISICWLTGYGAGFSNPLSPDICGGPVMEWIPHGPAAAIMTPQTGVVDGGGYFVHLQAAKRAMAHRSSISGLANKEPLSGHHKAPQTRFQWTW
ncbi:hypothetical protein BGZ61DRAFT_96143 [Ilyonectria robusta]|uniref:uncharacterized protein n=1 Tax=Ilyonectria robusta TaxID=1079257 RepID=UPI001E8E4F3F|nr:uncharacterized protein BGZ61DRAFT_96143 [Ilyonectria robusta]KAH8736537.1 hypothetical protein BGZ61DRAFT_96143 [Ilyonectria robusta]